LIVERFDFRRFEKREIFEPKAGGFGFRMAEHPWLNELGLSDSDRFLCIAMHDGVFDGDAENWCVPKLEEELRGAVHLHETVEGFLFVLLMKPNGAGVTEESAWRMSDEKVPGAVEMGQTIPEEVVEFSDAFGGLEVTRPGIMPSEAEGVSDHSGTFTGDKNAHRSRGPILRGGIVGNPIPFGSECGWMDFSINNGLRSILGRGGIPSVRSRIFLHWRNTRP